MRALLQRVSRAAVSVGGEPVAAIGQGLAVLLGVGEGDRMEDALYLARKTASLRIFADIGGKLNRSVKEIGGSVLVVSQFTLYADTSHGNRPGFSQAADAASAEALYNAYVAALRAEGLAVATGVFQAHMLVEIVNEGPVTILLESPQETPKKA